MWHTGERPISDEPHNFNQFDFDAGAEIAFIAFAASLQSPALLPLALFALLFIPGTVTFFPD